MAQSGTTAPTQTDVKTTNPRATASQADLTETLIVEPADDKSIRPFTFHASDQELADLKRRIKATRWPERELVDDGAQGVQLELMQKLADYWANEIRLAPVRGTTERSAELHHRDRGAGHPFHPCSLEA